MITRQCDYCGEITNCSAYVMISTRISEMDHTSDSTRYLLKADVCSECTASLEKHFMQWSADQKKLPT